MINIKKLGVLGLTVFASTSFITGVQASEAYYRITEFKKNDTALEMNCSPTEKCPLRVIPEYTGDPPQVIGGTASFYSEFSNQYAGDTLKMFVKGYNLETSKSYDVTFGGSVITKTGTELNTGFVFESIDLFSGPKEFKIVESEDSSKVINYAVYNCDQSINPECVDGITAETTETRFSKISFKFSDYSSGGGSGPVQYIPTEAEVAAMDAMFAKIAPGGIINVKTIDPYKSNARDYMWDSLVSAALNKEYGSSGYVFFANPLEDGTGDIQLSYENPENGDSFSKTYDVVSYKYLSIDTSVKSVTDEISELIKQTFDEIDSDFYKRYIIEDLDSINYYYNAVRSKNSYMAYYGLPSYSTKLQNKIGSKNIDFMFDPRAGDDPSPFHRFYLGAVNILYSGQVYSNVDPVGFALNNIIYIDDDVEKDDASFIAAAKERISGYLKNVEFEIEAAGTFGDLDELDYKYDSSDGLKPLFDLDKTTGSIYVLTIGEDIYPYFIVADSSKKVNPSVKTMDIKSNVYMVTDSFETPLDSKIYADKLDKNSAEYKALAKKLNIIEGLAYDLNLYSNSLDMYIQKLENGKFKVYIPVSEATTKKSLTAVYVKEDGTLESHPVKFEGNYAVFETDHFSTYTLVDAKNPKTGDNLVLYLLVLTASGYALYKARKFN